LLHDRPSWLRYKKRAAEMDVEDWVKLVRRHFIVGNVTPYAGVMYDGVHSAKTLERSFYDRAATILSSDGVIRRDRLSPGSFDLSHNVIRSRSFGALQPREIIHYHSCPASGELKRIHAPDSPAGSGYDHDMSVK
jgi:hypothetical protein